RWHQTNQAEGWWSSPSLQLGPQRARCQPAGRVKDAVVSTRQSLVAWVVGAWPAWGKEKPDLTDSGIRDKFTPGLLDSRFRRRRGPGTCTPGFWKRRTLSTCSTVNISCLTAAKNAPADKDATKPAPKEALPQEALAESPKEAPPEDQSPTAEEPAGIFLKKPDSVSVETGKDAVILAKLNGKELPDKPAIKWFKGKWLELDSKSGARFSFKVSHDSASNVRTLWGLEGLWARAGDRVELLGRGCAGQEGRMFGPGQGAPGHGVCVPRELSGSGTQAPRGQDCPGMGRDSWPFLGALRVVYTLELHIRKVVLGDRGDYRLEVKAKDICDSCAFKIDVEAPNQDSAGQSLESFKRSGEKMPEGKGELDFSSLLQKRQVVEEGKKKKKDDDDLGIPPEIWELLKGAKKSEYERIAFQYGITDLRGMLKRLKKAKVEVKKSAAFTKKLDPAYQVDRGNKIKLVVEISNPDLPLKWFKNGQEIKPSSKHVFENVGKKRILTINKCTLADDAAYEVVVKDEKCFTEVFVREPPVLIVTPLEDQQVFVGDRVEMAVEVSEEGAQVMWTKDGVELTREDSFKSMYRFKKDGKRHILIYSEVTLADSGHYQVMTNGGQFHRLTIDDVRPEDEGDYTFVPDGYALSLSATLKFLEITVEYVPKQEPPKIHLDFSGKTSENTVVVVAGNKLRLDVSITGEPPPVATWMKEDEVFSGTEGRVHIEKQTDTSSFVIESTERADEGRYTIKVTNPVGEDVASIFLRVVDVPDPPEAVRVTSVGEDWATLVWEPPKYDGGQMVTGYLLERRKKGSQHWMKLNFEVFTETTYESTNMIEGILYEMRVFAVNAIGVSQPSVNTKPFMPIAPTSEPQHLTVEDVTDTTATLKWRPPDRIGAGGIDGYLLEYRVEGSDEWIPANTELVERCGFTVKNLPTGARITFRVVGVNIAGRSQPATLAQPVTIQEIVEQPKIRLPRHLRQTYIRKVGEHINLVIPFQGKPRPQVTWTKGGAPIDTSHVLVHTSDFDTVFFVREAARSDSGEYELSVQIENMKDTATIHIRVVEKAGPPENVMVKEVWGTNALVEWKPPKDDGNSEITGYFVQKADKKTMEWFNVYEHNRQTSCTVSDLIMGNEYYFRVYSENICGLSDSPGVSKNTACILKTGVTFKMPEYKEHDFRTPPKFLTPLPDRVVVAGYAAALNCAVRGYPKPKVVWMKNKMEISGDPRFLMNNYLGVLTLNIRRPSSFDSGTYSCLAVNELGEALAECKLEVR
ncbi:hypothetical protein EI555_018426, partial [Monodon monoceros]